jgi:2-dehydropantoate 2-reductase
MGGEKRDGHRRERRFYVKKRIVIVGAGAVGGYVGGHLARSGEDIRLIDAWPEHVDCIRKNGLHFKDPNGEYTVAVDAMHICDVQRLFESPVDIAFISTKSYDTAWATAMISQYLAPDGFVVSLQNSINEAVIAGIVGWGKTIGCIASGISVNAYEAGHIMRTVMPGQKAHTVFRVGEVHGRVTQRVAHLAEMLSHVDHSKVTTNLWGERWSKLVLNAMHNAVSAVTGLNSRSVAEQEPPRRVSLRLGCEAVQVGRALGYDLEPIRGIAPERLLAAAGGNAEAMAEIEAQTIAWAQKRTESGRPSTAQDILKGRRTEIDYLNGLVAGEGEKVGIPAPVNAAITAIVREIESRKREPNPDNVSGLLDL